MKEFFDKIREDVNNIIKPRKGDYYDHFNGYAIIPVEDYFNLLGEELPQKYADAIASYKNGNDLKDNDHLNEANDILSKNHKSGYYDHGPNFLKTCHNDCVDSRARNFLDVSVYSGVTSQTNFYGEKQRNESSEIFALTKKLNEVNMRLAMLCMSMENSELKHTQQYKDLISIVEYIGMDFKPNE